MYKYWVEKVLRGLSKNFSAHNVPFCPIFVIILIKNQFITCISSVKSLFLNLYKILFNSLYRQKLSFKLYRCYHSTCISRNTHKEVIGENNGLQKFNFQTSVSFEQFCYIKKGGEYAFITKNF